MKQLFKMYQKSQHNDQNDTPNNPVYYLHSINFATLFIFNPFN